MDTSFAERLINRASTMLPPATVMLIECAGDRSGDTALLRLLEEVQSKGLRGEPLCNEPCKPIIFDDRVLLLCGGCERAKKLPRVAGIGLGQNAAEAHRNALYALTLPLDKPNTALEGCLAAQTWGSGDVRQVLYTCIINRAAYQNP